MRRSEIGVPSERSSELVARDLIAELVSEETAREILWIRAIDGGRSEALISTTSRGSRRQAGRGVCGIASGLAGSCAVTAKTPLESVNEIGRPWSTCRLPEARQLERSSV